MDHQPDLSEARRLLGMGLKLVQLQPYTKQPIGHEWNKHPVTAIREDATGYGLILAENKLCSIDPDNWPLARRGMAALGFDLDELMAAGVRTTSTRPGSGGRSTFAAEGDLEWVKFRSRSTGTVIEFRAASPNLQDCVPGLVYKDKSGRLCQQQYANGKRLDDAPPLPDRFLAWWERCSMDLDFLHEQERKFFAALETVPQHSLSTGKGAALAFPAPRHRTAYNSAHTVEELLEKHGYAYDRRLKRWAPPTATGEPGVRPIPGKDGLWRSDHASDPLSGTFDAWIACVVLEHGGDAEAAKRAAEAEGLIFDFQTGQAEAAQDENGESAPVARRMHWRGLEGKTPPDRHWLIENWLTWGVTHFAGKGGIGKTLVAQTVATALVLAQNFIDRVTEPYRVLMWACEDDHDELWRRQIAINRYFGCTMADLDGLVIEARHGAANSMFVQSFGAITPGPALKEWHEQIGDTRAQIAILDNIAHAFGGNENDRHHVTTFLNGLAPVVDWPVATLLLGHTARSAGSEYSGSGAWENAARTRWLISASPPDQKDEPELEQDDGVRYLSKRKANYSVNDMRRLAYTDGVYRCEAIQSGGSFSASARNHEARGCILAGLARLTALLIPTTAASNTPAYLPRKMIEMKLAGDFTRAELARALNELLLTGAVVIGEVGRYAKGGRRTGLKLAETDFPK